MTTKASGQTHGRGPSFVPPRGQRISPTKLTRSTIVQELAAWMGGKGDRNWDTPTMIRGTDSAAVSALSDAGRWSASTRSQTKRCTD